MLIRDLFLMIKNRLNRDTLYSTPQYWDAKARDYQGQAISMWPNHILNVCYSDEQIAIIAKHLNSIQGLSVLDAGCGTGRLSRYLADSGAIVQGIDFSEKAIAQARELSSGDNPSYQTKSLFELNDREKFDIIVTCASITVACRNRSEALDVFQRFRHGLKSNGKILLMEPVHSGFLHRVLNLNLKGFRAVMEEAGFELQTVSHLHFWPMRLLLAYVNWPQPITLAGYHIGEFIFRLTRRKMLGDYVAILATVKNQHKAIRIR